MDPKRTRGRPQTYQGPGIAEEALRQIMVRAMYEALKRLAGSPARGSWIRATPQYRGVPMLQKALHAIYVSAAEVRMS